jgi:hypothetical protein
VGSGVGVGSAVGVGDGMGDADAGDDEAESGEVVDGVTTSPTGDGGNAGAKMRHARPANTNKTTRRRFMLK